ncbi:pentapeptide repeat-containing protein [Nostoc sp. FACHB-888]|uniref:pentapeptide repeat-containing protein n=1 Tax=Nostoc sp. FACHB-888 TaxID=2692842 RepID=UPI001687BE4F|nr:pentapeptide repeat-containing protein [Nostoc sp. FACHB-888]MBD2247949.1 pentapeptide repeat-containing protein [Nostoc sp. FACHB-888]
MSQPPFDNSNPQNPNFNLSSFQEDNELLNENKLDGNQNQALQGSSNKSVQGNANTVNQVNNHLSNIESNPIYNFGQINISSNNTFNSQPSISKSQHIGNKFKAEFVLTGSIDSINETKLKVIVEHLRKLANDLDITIIKVEEGSIKIIFEGSPEGIKRLEKLFKSGELTELSDFPVEDFHLIAVNFSSQNLRGRSFKGQNLEGADFSYADIQGTDFTNANLKNANFSYAKAGLQGRWAIYLPIALFLFVGLLGFFAYIANYLVLLIATHSLEPRIIACTTFILLTTFFITTISKGLDAGLKVFTLVGGIAVVFSAGIKLVPAFTGAATGVLIVAVAILGSMAVAGAIAAFNKTLATTTSIIVILAVLVSVIATYLQFIFTTVGTILITIAVIIAVAVALFSIYVGHQAIKGDKKYFWIRNIAIAIAATGGTSFRESDLTNSRFTNAVLRNVDFRKANLTNTNFYQVKMLDYAQLDKTYLQNLQLRNLLATGQGENQNFDHQNLRGVNLKGANVRNTSFIGADLSEANLQYADLSRAKLVQTQLDGTDFTGAILTGAFIEDWNITTDTKFDGVRCEYVYMRLPTPDNPDPHRKPDNRQEVFADGQFGDFIKPIFDTLDLYHNQGVDPRAIAISFKQLAENNPDAELEIVAMEKRGQDKFLLRAKTAIAADKSQLSAEYFDTYNQLKALAEQEVKALVAEKDSRIADLQNMVVTALQRPSFYSNVEQVGFMTNNPGGFAVGGSVDGDINNVQGENNQQRVSNKSSSFNLQGAQFGGGLVNADTVNAHQIGGNITNYNPGQKQNLAQAAADIQQLLNQLSQTYPTATTSQRMSVVVKAVDEIENNPALKARVIGALKAGGTEAFKELIDHPLVNILLASIEGWQEAE